MKNTKSKPVKAAAYAFVFFTLNSQVSTAFAQGSLTPPGAPAPTMKTLDQIEARTPIDAAHTPGDANYEAVISAPGSYYLTGNLGVTKPHGIHVTATSVTIDLNGFQITRSSGLGGDGITIDAAAHRCAIRDGAITSFANGVDALAAPRGVSIRRVRAANCTNYGLVGGFAGEIADCLAHDNSGEAAIFTYDGATLINCTATNNTAHYAIQVGSGEEMEAAWPHILKVKTKGTPVILVRGPNFFLSEKAKAGIVVHSPPVGQADNPATPEAPINSSNARERWMYTTYVELIVDGEIVDLNRIPLPADTPIIDERFKDVKGR